MPLFGQLNTALVGVSPPLAAKTEHSRAPFLSTNGKDKALPAGLHRPSAELWPRTVSPSYLFFYLFGNFLLFQI
jgi:hypothetical protein